MTDASGNAVNTRRKSIECCFASAIGALLLGFIDLFQNRDAAVVLKMGEVSRILAPQFEMGPILALGLLLLLGAFVSWVFQPGSRIDAFARGFGLFALLGVATPYQLSFTSEARLDGLESEVLAHSTPAVTAHLTKPSLVSGHLAHPLDIAAFSQQAVGRYKAILRLEGPAPGIRVMLTVRDLRSARIILRQQQTYTDRIEVTLQEPSQYNVEVEASGFRRVSAELPVDQQCAAFSLTLRRSSIPLSVQRLVAAERTRLQPISSGDLCAPPAPSPQPTEVAL